MKLIVGLGNPGSKYDGTRHNAGFAVLFELLRRSGDIAKEKFKGAFVKTRLAGEVAGLLLPQTYMNRSGDSVRPAYDFFNLNPEDVIVVHDELDLPLGRVKIKKGGGHGGHNGLRSISAQIGGDYIRIRCGIGRPLKGDVTGYVLGRFGTDDRELAQGMMGTGADAVEAILRSGVQQAMNKINAAQ